MQQIDWSKLGFEFTPTRSNIRFHYANGEWSEGKLTSDYSINISVAANVVPEKVARLCTLCEEGKLTEAAEAQLELLPLTEALFSEVNPIPVKTALAAMGLCTDEMRLPLCHMNSSTKIRLLYEMKKLNII